ncbi:hypothetical protein FE257_005413 [Aspergillus nanangensis]|uniref:Uncharacterized protein n=1 Tax=Aspergillus nanangensis TaxID=2582783 RepID=A0AAD4CQZ6_ASPNN|nr:hypothetical protein FE257_005413 [Aspergillus nanangensis]
MYIYSRENLLALLLMIPRASGSCVWWYGMSCDWYGIAPVCEETAYEIEDTIIENGERLVLEAWTKDFSAETLRDNKDITVDCYNDYGSVCWSRHIA